MGNWGVGVLENDTAGDLEVFWNEYVSRGRKHDPAFWTPKAIAELFRFAYFRGWGSGPVEDVERAEALLALGALFMKHRLPLPRELKRAVVPAANSELQAERLADWGTPTARRRVLVALVRRIGGRISARAGKRRPDTTVRQTKRFLRELPRWVEAVRSYRSADAYDEVEPQFVEQLKICLSQGIATGPRPMDLDLVHARLICLAFFAGWMLELDPSAHLALVKVARDANRGAMFWKPATIASIAWPISRRTG